MRKILLFTLLVVTLQLSAQDLIVTQSGETIKAYRTDVGEKMVYYQLEDAEDAPILKIQKADVLVIKLQNGKVVFLKMQLLSNRIIDNLPVSCLQKNLWQILKL